MIGLNKCVLQIDLIFARFSKGASPSTDVISLRQRAKGLETLAEPRNADLFNVSYCMSSRCP
jgi:hypothetical protein